MLMLSLVRALAVTLAVTLAVLAPLVAKLATWLVARSLNMPEPLVHATGLFVFVRMQDFESNFLKALCPKRLMRRLLALLPTPRKEN